MSDKVLKEVFVSNLNGTSVTEITVGSTVPPLCMLFRGLLLISYHLQHGEPSRSWRINLLVDFLLLVVPLVLSCTILADILFLVPFTIATLAFTLLYKIYRAKNNNIKAPFQKIIKTFQERNLDSKSLPSVTSLRVFTNLLTTISILAVDFPLFPRRYAKTETYGTGVMDFGVGAFIFANALVSPEARQRHGLLMSKFPIVARQLLSVWPLIFLGLGRLISVKAIGYHEHVSEYGMHWNFFFTLAVVRVVASLLLMVFPVNKSWLIAAVTGIFYQLILETTKLKMFILHGSDARGSRLGFLNANREGIFSLFGYVTIYMVGVQVGLYALKKRSLVKDWIQVTCLLLLTSFILFTFFHLLCTFVEPASRRMANLTFCIWILGQCLSFFSFILLSDLILVFAKHLVNKCNIPCSWNLLNPANTSSEKYDSEKVSPKEGIKVPNICLIDAVARNQLLFFLQSNVITGVVNMSIDTIHSGTSFSLAVLLLYMFCNCLIIYFLHIKNITLKFW
ncbi:phosphatidylinositol-glycan biosynthesis class W protein [Rhinatrema bivittatum]|uniref:phosphatidylinositol-glycan biosynthesis class W protein n=1 Tax=Rhinatrema bivittatum TaxID=194408 RepID=UPI00112EA188|nr:phosphatidylinositol-glycan biosynthesis class W protein [Rhinatrema bivittatum]XP_029467521.1 phosphatidylinositol-glycan biosynthesis class W protein [Rhinatrema bivittatum]XP_029467522.1 phosphatidylinositol-glycan biosynthesis class W protein [Rhinatrema bivittatum]XP_029467523.1 phosphatidylinositol-glycan biosynthesis class W protein [Rhinatrema bivittatum]XP_029467524.1 phosphatidylinositol-glycan biosynthesis class W protein [Rhinatrema bivittatum]XP_029467525.1 phosphatidylinositol